jgi:ParB family transcriptional regulator, chromosome partitioning protein
MGKLDELMRAAGGNADESMGRGTVVGAPAAQASGPPPLPARMQGIAKAKNAAEIPVDRIGPDPDQPREEFDEGALDRLAESLRARGQLQPIRVRWEESRGQYVIVCGERRWRAAQRAGIATMSCVIMEAPATPGELLALQLVENCVREDLTRLEQARAFKALMDANGWSGNRLAKELGVSQPSVVEALRLLEAPAEVQEQVDRGELSAAVVYEASKLADPDARRELIGRAAAEGLSREQVRQIRRESGSRSKGRGGKARRVTNKTYRAPGVGYRVTVECGRGVDAAGTRAALTEVLMRLEEEGESRGEAAA